MDILTWDDFVRELHVFFMIYAGKLGTREQDEAWRDCYIPINLYAGNNPKLRRQCEQELDRLVRELFAV